MNVTHRRLIDDILGEAATAYGWTGLPGIDTRVLQAMDRVPREQFVPADLRHAAFENSALPIGHGQTISQPYIVALMTDLARIEPEHRVLEIGTGSGYQAAILTLLAREVWSVERIPDLSDAARETLDRLGFRNVRTRIGNGWTGWPEEAPFDSILVTAAAETIPRPLVDQLLPGGRLVIPIENAAGSQQLVLLEKDLSGTVTTREILPVRFVPLINAR